MEDGVQQLSLRLYDILEAVGASEEMRHFYRRNIVSEIIKTVLITMRFDSALSCYHFGSYTEGTTVPDIGSDIDILSCVNRLPVHADISTSPDGQSYILIYEEGSCPGYVKIQLVINRQPVYYIIGDEQHAMDGCKRVCLKNESLQPIDSVRHGPAFNMDNGDYLDNVPALRCITVPSFAKKWTDRCRLSGWPSQQLIARMSEMSCFVVGVGNESSLDRHIEWRLSFSLQERELMLYLNPVQHKCYILMKMIKRDIVKPRLGEEILTSYHCKTALFHVIEKYPSIKWTPDNLIQCLMKCILYLYHAVYRAFCPMFFLDEVNLFDREAFRQRSQSLLEVLESILQKNCQVILDIKCCYVGDIFSFKREHPSAEDILSTKVLLYLRTANTINIFNNEVCRLFCRMNGLIEGTLTLYNILRELTKIKKKVDHPEQQTMEALTLIIPIIHYRMAIDLAAYAIESRDDQKKERILRLFERHFQYVQHVDVMAASLLYVTVMFKMGEYEMCRALLEERDRSLSLENLISRCRCYEKPQRIGEQLETKIGSNNISQHRFMTTYIVTCIKFLPSEHAIVHPALKLEMIRSKQTIPGSRDEEWDYWFDWAVVDGKVYFYFLQYLVYSMLNKPVHKKAAIDNMKWVIRNDKFLNHPETAYNLLGWMYKEENRVKEALLCWTRSWEIRPHHNAAKWHYALLRMNRQR